VDYYGKIKGNIFNGYSHQVYYLLPKLMLLPLFDFY